MSEFDVILGMDWLTSYRVVIDCERRRVTAYTQDGTRVVVFQGDKHDILPPDSIRVQVSGTVSGMAREPYPRGRGETRLSSTSSYFASMWMFFQMSFMDYLHRGL